MEAIDSATNSSAGSSSPPSSSPSSSPPAQNNPPVVLTPCAACKILRRRCADKCVLAPYFPPTEPTKFTIAHRVFGASNIIKFLQVPQQVLLSVLKFWLVQYVISYSFLSQTNFFRFKKLNKCRCLLSNRWKTIWGSLKLKQKSMKTQVPNWWKMKGQVDSEETSEH